MANQLLILCQKNGFRINSFFPLPPGIYLLLQSLGKKSNGPGALEVLGEYFISLLRKENTVQRLGATACMTPEVSERTLSDRIRTPALASGSSVLGLLLGNR